MIIPAYIKKVMNILADAGYQVCIVGGAVRDSLRGVDINDYDLTTDAVPEVTASLMEGAGYKVIDNNSFKFGTVVAIDTDNGNEKIEITTFRSDLGYGDARHPDEVSFTGSIEKDAARRDFTVNALYMDVDGNIKDPTGLGEGDVKAGLIRAVGDPGERFGEDALRILRAVRFEAQTGFAIEENTALAMKVCAGLLRKISAERIFCELTKTLTAPFGPRAVRDNLEVISVIVPELAVQKDFDQRSKYHDRDLLTHTLDTLDYIPVNEDGAKDISVAYAALLHDIGKPEVFTVDEYGCGHMKKHAAAGVKIAERIADELKFSKMLKHEVTELVLYHDSFPPADKKSVKKFVSLLGFELVQKLFVLQKADILAHSKLGLARLERLKGIVNVYEQILEEDPCMSVDRLEITGKDILDLGCPEGPEVGKILQDVLDKVMSEELSNSREEIIDYVRRVFDIK